MKEGKKGRRKERRKDGKRKEKPPLENFEHLGLNSALVGRILDVLLHELKGRGHLIREAEPLHPRCVSSYMFPVLRPSQMPHAYLCKATSVLPVGGCLGVLAPACCRGSSLGVYL